MLWFKIFFFFFFFFWGGGGVEKKNYKFFSDFYFSLSQIMQGSRLIFFLTSPVASDNLDFTSQNQFSTSQNFQTWGELRKGRHFNF